jgi:hypothetical protein
VQDFTIYQIGQKIEGELIVDCPYCHKTAVRRDNDGIKFIHSIRITRPGGFIKLDIDSCPKTERIDH